MTYVREQSSEELAQHIRSLQRMAGWFDPLADRLWQEVQQLKTENEALRRDKSDPCDGCFMAEAEALRKDAERYQFLKNLPDDDCLIERLECNTDPENWDSVIDKSMSKDKAVE